MSRLPLTLGLLAGMACGIALSVTRPSAADPTQVGRVIEAPVRYDLHASCPHFADQLEAELDHVWARERVFGDVQVRLVIERGRVQAVQTSGRFSLLNHAVRTAAQRLSCGPQAPAGPQTFSFNVSFIDPDRTHRAEAAAKVSAMAGHAP